MSDLSPEEIAHLEDLLALERDAELPSSGKQELADFLRRSANARSLYLKQKQLSASLYWLYQIPKKAPLSWWPHFSWKPILAVAAAIILGAYLATVSVPKRTELTTTHITTTHITTVTPVLESISGWVEVISPDGDIMPATEGSNLQKGYTLRTRNNPSSISSATLRYPDQSRLTLGMDTELLPHGIHQVNLRRGVLHADVQSQLRIQTPQSTILAPKARCVFIARKQGTKMRVEEGELQIENLRFSTPLFVRQGEQLILSSKEVQSAVTAPATIFPEEWNTSWNHSGDSLVLGKVDPALQAITLEPYQLPTNNQSYHFLVFQNEFEGLFLIQDDSVLELFTQSPLAPHWFNLFIMTRETQPDGTIITKKYQLDNSKFTVPPGKQQAWLKRRYPINMMMENLGGVNYGSSPPPGALVTHLFLSHPEPSRGLLFRSISLKRGGDLTPSMQALPTSNNIE